MENQRNIVYPYSDDYMIFDKNTNRYILTEKYTVDVMGLDLAGMINERNGINPQILIKRFLTDVSDDIYEYIHSHSIYNAEQDYCIAKYPSLRAIIQKAMDQQLMYSRFNGLLGYSANKDQAAARYCPKAIETLNTTVLELGRSILYSGIY